MSDDWKHLQLDPSEMLAQSHFFVVKKKTPVGEVELHITIREYATADFGNLLFFAQTDEELNQKAAPFRPCGWHNTLTGALNECLRNSRRFEYEGPAPAETLTTKGS